jgi:hypothetical protein
MSGNFFEMRCPKCGDDRQIEIQAMLWVRVCEDGTDAGAAEEGSHDWEPDSSAICRACGHSGQVHHFEPAEAAQNPAI